MKKLLFYILIVFALGSGAYQLKNKIPEQAKNRLAVAVKERKWKDLASMAVVGRCEQPFLYSIGAVDPRFDLSQEKIIEIAKKGEGIWDSQTGKNLLEYDANSPFKINLVFDERQEETFEAEALEQKLKKIELSDAGLKKQYDAAYANYSKKIDAYKALEKKYESNLKSYNKDVKYWNEKGGAPADEYEKLQEKQAELKAIFKDLEKKRKEINKLAEQLNSLVKKENQAINSYNAAVNTYRNKFGGGREFEKGVYNGEAINIYQFNEESDLALTVAHELGHALGIGHVENPQSLMYYLMADQDMESPKLSPEDLAAINIICN